MAYRSTPATRSTGLSPYQLVFGRTMSTPPDIDLLPKKSLPVTFQEHLNETISNLKVFKEIAEQNVRKNQTRYKTRDATHVWGKNRKTGNKYSCHQLPFPSYPNLFRPTSPQLSLIEEEHTNRRILIVSRPAT